MPSRKIRITPRKQPVQARAQRTVRTIIEATAQVLVAVGYQRTTTDAIAARAGVSIGTLYQYFPNTESLVAALIREHIDEIFQTVSAALECNAEAPLDNALVALIRAGVDTHRINPALHKVLFEQVPRDRTLGKSLDASTALQAMIENFLHKRAPKLAPKRIKMIALVLESTIEALTHRAVVEAPDWLGSGEIEKETIRLLRPYLAQAVDQCGHNSANATPVTAA